VWQVQYCGRDALGVGETSAKALRGGEMADVIFNGTDRRSALGMAEVTLTLSGCEGVLDTEFDEVSLGRRVFRDGKGEYLINKQACRLKDIHSLLMDTGVGRSSYSIMEQGKIDMLLSSKPEDRRAVFEEAAGITKYKAQKKEALRKLDYTEANMLRIRDIVAESERQIRSLSRQASKAKRYRNIHENVRTLELHLSHRRWRELHAEKSELLTSVQGLRLEQDEIEDAIECRQAKMAAARYEYQEIENHLSELQTSLARLENEINNANNRIEFNGERSHEQAMLIQKNEEEIENASRKTEQQQRELQHADEMLGEVEERIKQHEQLLAEKEEATLAARSERESLSAEIREIEQESSQTQSRLAALEATIETNERQADSDRQRLAQVCDEIERHQKDGQAREEDAAEFKGRISKHHESINHFEEALATMEQKYHQAKRAATDMQEDLSALHKLHAEKQSRMEVMEQLVADGESFEKGTQSVLGGLDDPETFGSTVHQPLSAYLEVEQKFAEAIEAALGRQLQTILVDDVQTAEKVIAALRKDNLGQASLIAADSLASNSDSGERSQAPLGSVCWADEVVTCRNSGIQPLIQALLGHVLLVENLSIALRLGARKPGLAMATLEGEFVSREGIIHGGASGDESASVLKRQAEIRDLRKLVASLHGEVDARQVRRDQLNERVDQLEGVLAEARDRLQRKRVSSSTLEGKLALIERDLNQLSNRIESLRWEMKEIEERKAKIEDTLSKNRQERDLSNLRITDLERKSEAAAARLTEARGKEELLVETVTEARTQLAVEKGTRKNIEEQRSPMADRLSEMNELLERKKFEIIDYQKRIERATVETAELREQITDWEAETVVLRAEHKKIHAERSTYSSTIEEGEEELTQKRQEVQKVAERRGKEELKISQLDLYIENLENGCRERYQAELEVFEPDSHALLAVIESQKEQAGRKGSKAPQPKDQSDEAGQASEANQSAPHGEIHSPEKGDHQDEENVLTDPGEPDWEFIEETVAYLRTRLDSMGPVNVDAISEFDELEEHYNFHIRQLKDLENSRDKLLRMIARINRETRRMFSDTFEKIRINFRDMFKELFGGKAKADLVLMDDADPLECGIDIIAKPPGKKLQSISLLSGGERSMTAVALLFGIYMVKPSPFCVLDELDAPLDEANINRFIRVLDRFIGSSQFVIVTHSKRTMSRADVMYGVSMEEFGVSKTVGVKFSKADQATPGAEIASIGK